MSDAVGDLSADLARVILTASKAARRQAAEAMRERAARIVEGEIYKEHYRMWPSVSSEGNRSNDSELVWYCDALAAAIRALPIEDAS